jgi:large subunit ribosomal protein L4
MKIQVVSLEGKKVGEADLNDDIFGRQEIRIDLLDRAVQWQQAKKRAGTHMAKTISGVSGTTKKPYAQKGTGNARQGSLRSPQFRGGGVIFGPVVRSHAYDLPKKVRQLALKNALSSKAKEGKLIVLDVAKTDTHKTKDMVSKLKKLGLSSALIIDGANLDLNFCRAVANIPMIDVLPEQGANVYDILRRDTLVLTKNAVEQLEARLK